MTHPLDALIAALQFAKESDRRLDNLIAGALKHPEPDDPAGWPPRYTWSLDDALRLIPLDANTHGYERTPKHTEAFVQRNYVENGHWAYYGEHQVLPIAMCIAALKAIRSLSSTVCEEK